MIIKELQNNLKQILASHFSTIEVQVLVNVLLKYRTGYDNVAVNLYPKTEIDENIFSLLKKDISQLLEDYPIQYIVNNAHFYGEDIYVDDNVLIPRPETEELVQWVLSNMDTSKNILDICTGSACIAIVLKKKSPQSDVFALDISAQALAVAKRNAQQHQVDINFFQKDILDTNNLEFENHTFDIMISNPPYVTNSEKAMMHRRVLNYEPKLALFVSDNQPLLFYNAIANFAQYRLNLGGYLYLEINERMGEEVQALLRNYGFDNIELKKDFNNKDRMIKALKVK